MVVMIYRMLAQDLAKFGLVFTIFIFGFSQEQINVLNQKLKKTITDGAFSKVK